MSEQIDSLVSAPILGLAYGIGVTFIVNFWIYRLIGPNSKSSIIVGLIAGYWFARKYFYAKSTEIEENKEVEEIKNPVEDFRHPCPRAYQTPLPHLFSQVRDTLEEMVFDVGDKWHVVNTDTAKRRMTLELRLNDKDSKKYLKASIQFNNGQEVRGIPEDATLMYIEFDPRSESGNYTDLDYYMQNSLAVLDGMIKPIGTAKPEPVYSKTKIKTIRYKIEFQPVPEHPRWFIGSICTGIVLLGLDFCVNGSCSSGLNNSRSSISTTAPGRYPGTVHFGYEKIGNKTVDYPLPIQTETH